LGTGASVTAATLHRGTHTVTATVRNATGLTGVATVQLTVFDRPPAVTITAPQDGRLFPVHFAATFTATATDNVDGDLGASLVWTSDRDGQLGTGRSITTSTLSVGDHRITASVTNSLGTTGSAAITVTVGNGAPKVKITAPADGTGVDEGTTVTFTGTASDPEDGDLTPAIAWASDLQGALGTGGTVSARLTTVGTHHITATAAAHGHQDDHHRRRQRAAARHDHAAARRHQRPGRHPAHLPGDRHRRHRRERHGSHQLGLGPERPDRHGRLHRHLDARPRHARDHGTRRRLERPHPPALRQPYLSP